MKKTLLICLYFLSVFTCLAYSFPVNKRLIEDTDSAHIVNDCLVWKQQSLTGVDVGEFDKSKDLIVTHSDLVFVQHDDKPSLADVVHSSSNKHILVSDITVSISPTNTKAFIIKGDPLTLTAETTTTIDLAAPVKYEWYYVNENGETIPIVSGTGITLDGNKLEMKSGLDLVSNKPTGAPDFSLSDHIPALGEIVSKAIPSVSAGIYAGVSKNDLINAFGDKIKNYVPKEYTTPIGVRVIIGDISATSSLFTRPVFTKPAVPTYTVGSPTSCCQEEVITLTNTSPDVNDPDVIYMWLWYPSNKTPQPATYPFTSTDLAQFVTQGNLSIPMKKPSCSGNYTLMAFSGATSCFSVAEPTDVKVYPKPTYRGNTQLKTNSKGKISNTYCEGEKIIIEGDKVGLNSDQDLDIGYQWYDKNGQLIASPAGTQESYSIANATPAMSGICTRVATTNASNSEKSSHCSVTATISITVKSKLAKPGTIRASENTCDGGDLILSVEPVVGASQYRWTYSDMATGGRAGVERNAETSVPTFVRRSVTKHMAVTYTVRALDDNGCESPLSDGTKVDLLDKTNAECVKVYINPIQNMAFVCKGDPFALRATITPPESTDKKSDAEKEAEEAAKDKDETGADVAAEYEWYYVKDGIQLEKIESSISNGILIVRNKLIMTNGPQVTNYIPAEATAFSIADNIPGLTDILKDAKNHGTAFSHLPDVDAVFKAVSKFIPDELKNEFKDAAGQKLKGYLPKDLDKYAPKEYTMPITAKLIKEGGGIKNATPFTRPIFERPNAPKYSIKPTSCCPGDVVTFSSDDNQSDPAKPEVMYMWLGLPGSSMVPTSDEFGLGSAFVPNLDKVFTKGPVSITIGSRYVYTGNYALSAFRGAPSPVGCSSIGMPTQVIVHGLPTSDRNTKLKTKEKKLTYCEGEEINIMSFYSTGVSDALLGIDKYQWVDNKEVPIPDGDSRLVNGGVLFKTTAEHLKLSNATADMSGTYTRYAITKYGCKTAATITINISPKPAPPTGLTSNSPICAGDNLVISVSPAVGVTAYEWAGPSGAIRTSTTSTLTITSAQQKDMGTYSVKAKDANNCVSDAATITVDLVPNNLATLFTIGSNAPVVEGASLALSATIIPGATYEWKGPDGFNSNDANPIVSAAVTDAMSGTYQLTVKKCNGTHTASQTIQVDVLPKSVLDITNTNLIRTICSGDGIDINFQSKYPGTTYKWTAVSTGNITGYSQNKHDVLKLNEKLKNSGAETGAVTYTVTPIFKDGTNEITGNSKDFVVTVVPIKKATITDQSKTEKNMVSFTWKPIPTTGAAVTYTWYSGPNKTGKINTGVSANGDYTFDTPTPGTYTRYVTTQEVGDPCESAPTKLELNVEHDITLSFNRNSIDQGESAVLTAKLPGGITAPAEGITITLQPTVSSFAISPTIYIPAGSSSGFTTIVTTKSLIMDDDEKIHFIGTKAAPYTIIPPTDLTIKKDQSLSTITLKFNQASVKGGEHATLTAKLPDGVLATQRIEILLEADDDHSTAEEDENYKDLRASMTIDVGANSKTIEAFTAKNKGVIDGLTHLQLKAKVLDPKGYHIADPKPKISISDTTGDDPANRVMTLAFKKPSVIGGDIDELIISLPKGIVSANNITVTLNKDQNTERGTSRAKRNINYESFPDAIRIRAFRNSATYPLTTIGDEKVSKITTMAISGTALGYEFKSLAKVSIISGLHVPNVFTPGGVGDHPTWMIKGLHLYPNCDVKVFNRYGQIVFKSHGYAEPWNGGYENNLGKEMPVGTYYYVIELNDSRGAKRVLKGHVAIIR